MVIEWIVISLVSLKDLPWIKSKRFQDHVLIFSQRLIAKRTLSAENLRLLRCSWAPQLHYLPVSIPKAKKHIQLFCKTINQKLTTLMKEDTKSWCLKEKNLKELTMANSTKAMRVECNWSPRSLMRVTCITQENVISCIYKTSYCMLRGREKIVVALDWPHRRQTQRRFWHHLQSPAKV